MGLRGEGGVRDREVDGRHMETNNTQAHILKSPVNILCKSMDCGRKAPVTVVRVT